MSYGKIDIEDAILGGIFTLGAFSSTNLFNISFVPGGGTDLSAAVWTIQGVDITFAFLVSMAALIGAYLTNRAGSNRGMDVDTDLANIMKGKSGVETYVLGATIVVMLALGVDLLGFRAVVVDSPVIGGTVFVIQGAGYYVISYLG